MSTNFDTKSKKLLKKEINEIKKAVQDVKEELNKDIESFNKKKNQTAILEIKVSLNQIKITVESHSSRS
jgi:Sec-independent protein translocase protein TatA